MINLFQGEFPIPNPRTEAKPQLPPQWDLRTVGTDEAVLGLSSAALATALPGRQGILGRQRPGRVKARLSRDFRSRFCTQRQHQQPELELAKKCC